MLYGDTEKETLELNGWVDTTKMSANRNFLIQSDNAAKQLLDLDYSEIEQKVIAGEIKEVWLDNYPMFKGFKMKKSVQIQILEDKLTKLKQLLLLVDPVVSNETMNPLSIKQWTEFIKEFPDEGE